MWLLIATNCLIATPCADVEVLQRFPTEQACKQAIPTSRNARQKLNSHILCAAEDVD